jgi:hypothetical protein
LGGWVTRGVTKGVYGVVEGVGWVCGLRGWYEEYTPLGLRGVAEEEGRGKKRV